MAENGSNEGLDRLLSYFPRNASAPALDTTLYLAALSSHGTVDGTIALDGTKVPNRLTIWGSDYKTSGGAGRGSGGEPTVGTGGYARKSVANSAWGSPATNGQGRRVTTAAQNFATSTAAWTDTDIIGYAIVTSATPASGIAYGYTNFDDNSIVVIGASGLVLRVPAYWQFSI